MMKFDINIFLRSIKCHYIIYYKGRKSSILFLIKKFILSLKYLLSIIFTKKININISDDVKVLVIVMNDIQSDKIANIINQLDVLNVKYKILKPNKNLHYLLSYKNILKSVFIWVYFIFKKKYISYGLCDGLIHILNYYSLIQLTNDKSININLIISVDPASQFIRCASIFFNKNNHAKSLCFHYGFPSILSKDYNTMGFITYVTYSLKYKKIIDNLTNSTSTLVSGDVFSKE